MTTHVHKKTFLMEGISIALDVLGIDDVFIIGWPSGFLMSIGIESGELTIQVRTPKGNGSKEGTNDEGQDQTDIQHHSHTRIPSVDDIQEDVDSQKE